MATVGCLLVAGLTMAWVSERTAVRGFKEIERDAAHADTERVQQAILNSTAALHTKSADWANWDDTYQFAQDRNKEYVKSNLVEESLRDINVTYLGILDRQGGRIAGLEVRDASGRPVEGELLTQLKASGLLQRGDSTSGIIMAHADPVQISLRPILTTAGEGPSNGWMLFAKRLDRIEQLRLQQVTRQNFTLKGIPKGLSHASTRSATVEQFNSEFNLGKAVLRDVLGKACLMLEVKLNRRTSAYGNSIVGLQLLQMLTVAALLALTLMVVVEKSVLKRLRSVVHQISSIDGDLQGNRVHLPGRDELNLLVGEVNTMLSALECSAEELRRSREALRLHNDQLEGIVEERTRQIEHQSLHDKLTGLPNRALFGERLNHSLIRARRNQSGTAVVFVDLDNFKLVNDSMGHDVGDRLLIEVGKRLQTAVREGDTVARLGGDEFTIILEEVATLEEGSVIAQRILDELKPPVDLGVKEIFVCASLGLAISNGADCDGDELLKRADAAMYRAKAGGKSMFVIYDESMQDYATERLELETGLRKALEQGQIHVFYQPIMDFASRRLIGAEALVRWLHPERGIIGPAQFIPIAEETGLIIPIGRFVLEQACARAKQWMDVAGGPFVMNVNVSIKQLHSNLVQDVKEVLAATALPPECLKLEITESMLMSNLDEVVEKLIALKLTGVKIALDDFGTGYSSLSNLQSLPIDTLKVDRSFTNRLGPTENGTAIVEAIAALARTLKMDVTGEGVETVQQEEALHALGVQAGQGYLYAKPLSESDFDTMMQLLEEPLADAA